MAFPNFSEFLASISPEEYEARIGELSTFRVLQLEDACNPKAIANAILKLYNEAMKDANKLSLLNLQLYHEWLQEHLE